MVEDDNEIMYYTGDRGLHRVNGPARIWKHTDDWGWYLFNDWHRYYGNARSVRPWYSTAEGWYIHGDFIK